MDYVEGCSKCSHDRHPCWQCGAPVGHSEHFCDENCADNYERELVLKSAR